MGLRLSYRDVIASNRLAAGGLVLLSLAFAALSLTQPLLVAAVFEQLGNGLDPSLLFRLAAVFVSLAAASILKTYFGVKLTERIAFGIRKSAVLALIASRGGRRPDSVQAGTVVVNDAALYAGGVVATLTSLPNALIAFFVGAVCCMWMMMIPFLAASGVACMGIVVVFVAGPRIRDRRVAVQDVSASLLSRVEEACAVAPVVRSYDAVDYFVARLAKSASSVYRKTLDMARLQSVVNPVLEFILQAAFVAATLFALGYYALGYASLDRAVAFVLLFQVSASALQDGLSAIVGLQEANAGRVRLENLVGTGDSVSGGELCVSQNSQDTELPLSRTENAIEFDSVFFSYGDRPVLKGVTFGIPAVGMTTIVGESGAGKTTIVKLILGELVPDDGAVRRSISGLPIGFVNQDSTVIEGTIADNIRFGRNGISDDDIMRALNLVGLQRFATKSGIEMSTERGLDLSGGERQRLCLARACVVPCAFLVLDEPTSNVDGMLERDMVEAVAEVSRTTAVVVVTHRITTALYADRLIQLENGRVLNQGPPDECVERSSRLRLLLGDSRAIDSNKRERKACRCALPL